MNCQGVCQNAVSGSEGMEWDLHFHTSNLLSDSDAASVTTTL